MVSFDLSFRSILIEDIVEDEGELWTEGAGGGYGYALIEVLVQTSG